jgi:hypothetical protein
MRVANIPTNLRRFFHHWITVTFPLHNLGKTERGVLAELLYYRYLLGQEVTNEELLNKLLFDYETKNKICESLDIPKSRMALVLTTLRKEGIVKGRTLNKSYIPELSVGDNQFILAYKFKITDNDKSLYTKPILKETKENSDKAQDN